MAVVHAGYGYKPDDHEFQLTPQGTALIDARVPVRADLSSVGGSATGVLIDYVIQELDVKTGQVLWEWHALGHIPLAATYYGPPKAGPYDDLHLNSIQQLPDGNLLISGRHTWGVYLIDKQTGKIIWTVGGKYSSFRLGPGAQFEWQHDAHLTGNTLTLFDDASKPGFEEEPQSSAKAIRLNASTRTATLVRRYTHYPPIITGSQGSAQPLPNGNMFVGWGASPSFSEYRASGRQIFNGSFPLGVESYRAYRFPWTGKPVGPPSLGVVPGSDGAVRVYASWNGATRVAAWRVLGGTTPKKLRSLGQIPDTGFESSLRLASEPPDFVVQALDAAGQVIGTSVDRPDPPHVAVFPPVAFVNTTTGSGSVAVGCFTKDPCHFALKLSSGGSVLAQRVVSGPVAPGTGTLVAFTLSHGGRRRLLTGRSGRGLRIRVQLSDGSSGPVARRSITLIPYTTSGARLPRQVSQSPRLKIVQSTGFVSSRSGVGSILAACYAPVPCTPRVTVSLGGQVVARSAVQTLGVDELGVLSFKLGSAGRSMLRRATGNQLAARIVISGTGSGSGSGGRVRAVGAVALVGYR